MSGVGTTFLMNQNKVLMISTKGALMRLAKDGMPPNKYGHHNG